MTIIATQQVMIMANAILSKTVGNPSEIEALTERVKRLKDAVDFWNGWMIAGLIAAALSAVLIVLTTRLAVVRAKELSNAQGELDSAKGRQLRADLAEKDIEIGQLKTKSDLAESGIATANQKAAEATLLAEQEKLARVKIEASVAWRHFTDEQKADISRQLRSLHSPEPVTVWYFAGEAESAQFAGEIAEMLRGSGMSTFPPRPFGPPEPEKVSTADPISTHLLTGIDVEGTDDSSSRALVDKIRKLLNDNGFDAQTRGGSGPNDLAKNLGPNVIIGVLGRPFGPQGEAKLTTTGKKK